MPLIDEITCEKYLRRISSHSDVDELADINKRFLKDAYDIRNQFTYDELPEIFKCKHTSPELKTKISELSSIIEMLVYRSEPPTRKEMITLKALMRDTIKMSCEADLNAVPEQQNKELESLRKKEKELRMIKQTELAKEKLKESLRSKIEKKTKPSLLERKFDSEYNTVKEYIQLSQELERKSSTIRKELKMMGFQKDLVDLVFSELKK